MTSISVVIVTYRRPDALDRAISSVLSQTKAPAEVMVCDDCSGDQTEQVARSWEARDPRVRYLRTNTNSGSPAMTRNLGVRHARGDWVAFLDDDDEWLPHKLETQCAVLASEHADVVCSNGLRSDGTPYFLNAPELYRPTWVDFLRANPVLVCSALVRRQKLDEVGGFPSGRWALGIDDYCVWLDLAHRGATFIVLGEPLVRYEDRASGRLSRKRIHSQIGVTRLSWRYAFRPTSAAGISAAIRNAAGIGYIACSEASKLLTRN